MSPLTYYDPVVGRQRFKRRYVWAAWAFAGGIIMGYLLALLVR